MAAILQNVRGEENIKHKYKTTQHKNEQAKPALFYHPGNLSRTSPRNLRWLDDISTSSSLTSTDSLRPGVDTSSADSDRHGHGHILPLGVLFNDSNSFVYEYAAIHRKSNGREEIPRLLSLYCRSLTIDPGRGNQSSAIQRVLSTLPPLPPKNGLSRLDATQIDYF